MSSAAEEQTGSLLFIAAAAGGLSGAIITVTLMAVGLPYIESSVFGGLSGFTLAAFVYRERTLTRANSIAIKQHLIVVERLEKRIRYYYENSLACLAYFDATTFSIDCVSYGLLQLLRIPPEEKVRGKSIANLLRVPSTIIESIISDAKRENVARKNHTLNLEDSLGHHFKAEVSALYHNERHMVEFAIFVSPFRAGDGEEDAETTHKDLDRFRRGIYRRETRILQLKEEINEILKEAGKPPRYRFDQNSQDTHAPMLKQLLSKEES